MFYFLQSYHILSNPAVNYFELFRNEVKNVSGKRKKS